MKLASSSSTLPSACTIFTSWSSLLTTLNSSSYCDSISSHGESGKHDVPQNIMCDISLSGSFLAYESVTLSISAKMQPTLHMSIPWSYCGSQRMISGARYQRETTWLVSERLLLGCSSSGSCLVLVWSTLRSCSNICWRESLSEGVASLHPYCCWDIYGAPMTWSTTLF